jgi:hypothetical protein
MSFDMKEDCNTEEEIHAMAASVTSKLWEMADMVQVLEDWEAAKAA